MRNVLTLGANGQVAKYATDQFLKGSEAKSTLDLRNSRRLGHVDAARALVVQGLRA